MRGMLVGRFQPFHKGHLSAVQKILEVTDEIVIIIAAAQQSMSPKNPFTAGERFEMIRESLREEKIDLTRVMILPATNVNDNDLWVAHLIRLAPHFDVVYSNNPHTKFLFERAGKDVKVTPLVKRKDYSAENIRKLIVQGKKEWQELVPKAVVKIIATIKGEERVKIVNSSDKNYSSKK